MLYCWIQELKLKELITLHESVSIDRCAEAIAKIYLPDVHAESLAT